MDITALLFYPSWLNALRKECRDEANDPARGQDRPHGASPDGPNWRLALAPMALVAAVVLAGALFPLGV
jgi:hypothetical protein